MVEVVVQVTPEVAEAVRANRASPELDALQSAAADLGIPLGPQHPGVQDDALSRYFSAVVDDRDAALAAAARLRGIDGVSAAYFVPEAGLVSPREVQGDE